MYIPEMPEIQTKVSDHPFQEAADVAAFAFAGAVVGTWIDNNTKIGRWANTSPTADAIVSVFKTTAVIVGAGLAVLFVYCLLTT